MAWDLTEELRRGRELAEELVDHALRMQARALELAVLRAKPDGELVSFRVIVVSDNK